MREARGVGLLARGGRPLHLRSMTEMVAAAWRTRRGRRRELLLAGIHLGIVFSTWHALVRRRGLTDDQAISLMERLTLDC